MQTKNIDPASALVGAIVDQADITNVGFLARNVAAILKDESVDDVFAALALVMVDVVTHYATSHDVTLESFRLLSRENVRTLVHSRSETLQ